MGQNEQINSISSLDTLWGGTLMPIPDFLSYAAQEPTYSAQSIGISILVLLLFFVFFGEFFLKLISKMCISFLYPKDVLKISEESNLNIGFFFLFLLACPVFGLLLIRYEVLTPSHFQDYSPVGNTLIYSLFPLVFFILRRIFLFILGAVAKYSEEFTIIFKYSVSFFIIVTIISLMPLPITFLVSAPNYLLIRVILFSVIGILTIGYFFQIGRIIIFSQVSNFFSFLYLCTVEILPLVLMTYTAINLK